jgi:hypothetical protein
LDFFEVAAFLDFFEVAAFLDFFEGGLIHLGGSFDSVEGDQLVIFSLGAAGASELLCHLAGICAAGVLAQEGEGEDGCFGGDIVHEKLLGWLLRIRICSSDP